MTLPNIWRHDVVQVSLHLHIIMKLIWLRYGKEDGKPSHTIMKHDCISMWQWVRIRIHQWSMVHFKNSLSKRCSFIRGGFSPSSLATVFIFMHKSNFLVESQLQYSNFEISSKRYAYKVWLKCD